MSKEYIERGAMVALLEDTHSDKDWMVNQYNADWICALIESQPAADVVEVKHGRWKSVGLAGLKCSKCGHEDHWKMYYSYCPNCGADMRDGGADNG